MEPKESQKSAVTVPDKIRASHILVAQEFEAEDLVKLLAEGRKFEDLALRFSQCPSSRQGGDLGFFSARQMVEPFSEVAFGLKVGQISSPVRTQFGYHLILRTS